MQETHGNYTIMESTAEGSEGQFAVMNTSNGQVRRFPTVDECRQFIGIEEAPGTKWIATPLDPDGNALTNPAVVTGDDEEAAREAGKSWFFFIGVTGAKLIHVERQ